MIKNLLLHSYLLLQGRHIVIYTRRRGTSSALLVGKHSIYIEAQNRLLHMSVVQMVMLPNRYTCGRMGYALGTLSPAWGVAGTKPSWD